MRDADTGKELWSSSNWSDAFTKEISIQIPKSILKLRAISREMTFTSSEVLHSFRLVQSVYLHGSPLEEWHFSFGFVIPGSTNSWQ